MDMGRQSPGEGFGWEAGWLPKMRPSPWWASPPSVPVELLSSH